MKNKMLILGLLVFYVITFCMTEAAYGRSTSLTTTIIITVKPKPKSNLAPNDQNAEMVEKLAREQAMKEPYIKETPINPATDIKFSGEKIYTITDKL